MGKVSFNKKNDNPVKAVPALAAPTIIEKIVEVPVIKEVIVEVVKEVKVPEYITVTKEEKIEVPVFHEVIKEIEKIVEVPKIQVVEKPVYITKEVYNIEKYRQEVIQKEAVQKRLNRCLMLLAVSILFNIGLMIVR